MSTGRSYLIYSETALVAYAEAIGNTTESARLASYKKAGLSIQQAQRFDKTWQVLSQSPDHINGFSAVLLQNRATGEKVLAIRGTEPSHWGEDYVTDIVNIGLFGTVAGMPQYQSLDAYYAQLLSSGQIAAGEQVVVTGHSLGGFLAQAFTTHHDSAVSAAYTFNALGMRKNAMYSRAAGDCWTGAGRRFDSNKPAANSARLACAA